MNLLKILLISNFLLFLSCSLFGQQIADSGFHYANKSPVYKNRQGPVVTLDEAHFNYHTLSGRYYTFARLLEQDGYALNPGRSAFTSAYLSTLRILVIANALPDTGEWKLPTKSAFTAAEIDDLHKLAANGKVFMKLWQLKNVRFN